MMNASTFLTDYYVDAHNTDSAFVYQQATLNAKESQFNSEKNRELQNLAFEEMMRQQKLEEARLETALQRRNNLQYGAIGIFLVIFATVFLLLSRSFVVNERWVRFLGVLGLLLVFEFINLLLHPRIADITHHSPVATLLLMVIIAAVLIPLHHRLEHNVINRMVEKNKRIRLETAKKIVEQLGGEQSR
jgi:hypothetical protein